MDPQDSHIVFFQDDFMSSSFGHFDELREAKEFVDVTIVIRNRCFVGHKVVLAAAIPFFHLVLSGNEGGRVNLMFEELDPEEFESFMKFAYSGKIKITSQNVQSLYVASKKLGLHRVHDACYEFLVKGLNPNNAWKIRKFSKNCGNFQLTEAADHYILQNFEAFSKTEYFLDLPFFYLKEVLSSDDVRIAKEEICFEAVLRWVKASLSERRNRLRELLTQVRLCHLAPDYLVERVSSEDLVRNSAHCRELVDETKNYLLLSDKRSDVCSFATRPRIYERSRHEACTLETTDYGLYAICQMGDVRSVTLWNSGNEKWVNISTCWHENAENNLKLYAAVASNGAIYTFSRNAIEVFDLITLEWNQLDSFPFDLTASAIVLHKRKIYFFGGESSASDRIRCLDTQGNKWLKEGKMSRCFEFAGVASMTDFIFITGGCFRCTASKSVERYNPETKMWGEISPMLSKRWHHGCASLNGKIYVCGGVKYDQFLDTAEVYDPLTNQWNSVHPLESRGIVFSLVPHKGQLFAVASLAPSLFAPDIYVYNSESDVWKSVIDPVHEVVLCAIALVNVEIFSEKDKKEPLNEETVGGYKKEGSSMSSEEKLQLLKELKKQGNDFYNGKKYKEASEKYTEALNSLGSLLFRKKPSEKVCKELEEIKTSLLLNISQCKLKENDYYSVIGYTTTVLERDPDNVKGLYRRAKAHAGVWKLEEAESDYQRVLKLDSTLTSVIQKELKNLKTIRMQKEVLGN